MGSLSLNNSNSVMADVRTSVLQKREGSSEIETFACARALAENESSSKWQKIKIHGRKDDSTVHIHFNSMAPKEVCSGFSNFIDFSLDSNQKRESARSEETNVPKPEPMLFSEKRSVVEEVEHNSQPEKRSDKVKEEPVMNPCFSVLPSSSGTLTDRDEKCISFPKDEKCIYSKIFISKRRSVTKEEKDKAFQAARAFASNNPFFTVVMRPTHVYRAFYMSIPSSFVRTHLVTRIRDMNLETSGSRQWPVHCTFRKDYAGLRKGWSTFVWENNLEEGDACVFERIDGSVFTFRVHIFRVLEEIVPLSRSYMPYIPKIPRPTGRKRIEQSFDHQRVSEGSPSKPEKLDV